MEKALREEAGVITLPLIPEEWDMEADVVIVGFGGAGAATAMEAHDAGANVLILEKVAFQSVRDYEAIIELLADKKIRAWINCSRRMYQFYNEMRGYFNPGEQIFFNLFGGGWG